MELKRLLQQWNGFPELSMEERPILSSDLEKIVVRNPLTNAFYLRRKLLIRIVIMAILWLVNSWQLRRQWVTSGNDLYPQTALFILLVYSLYYHVRLLFFADYPTLLALPLINFLGKLLSALSGFYLLFLVEALLSRLSPGAYATLMQNDWYKWLILVFLSISVDILQLHIIIPGYRRLLSTVFRYRDGITAKAPIK
jgi:hypothetical protein